MSAAYILFFFFFQAEDGIRDYKVTGVQTCALPISAAAIAVRIDALEADCWSPIATSLPVRSDTDLISGRAMRTATRLSVLLVGADAVCPVSLGWAASVRPEISAL